MIQRIKKYIRTYTAHNWAAIAGKSQAPLLVMDCILCRLIYGTNTEQYVTMEFYRKNHRERKRYITNRRQCRINKQLLAQTSEEERKTIADKYLFNKKYAKWVKRGFISTEDSGPEEIVDFIREHQSVLVKPVGRTQGLGIYKLVYDPETVEATVAELMKDSYVLEEFIRQHPEMERINPSSVNSLRMVTILDKKGEAHIVNVELRGGGAGSVVDNYHSGGVCYPVDIQEGVVFLSGRGNVGSGGIMRHPSTGIMMMGFQIPHWDVVTQSLKEAAKLSENLRWLGWDVAVTEDGVELIEANYGHDASEIDNNPKYKLVMDLLGF